MKIKIYFYACKISCIRSYFYKVEETICKKIYDLKKITILKKKLWKKNIVFKDIMRLFNKGKNEGAQLEKLIVGQTKTYIQAEYSVTIPKIISQNSGWGRYENERKKKRMIVDTAFTQQHLINKNLRKTKNKDKNTSNVEDKKEHNSIVDTVNFFE